MPEPSKQDKGLNNYLTPTSLHEVLSSEVVLNSLKEVIFALDHNHCFTYLTVAWQNYLAHDLKSTLGQPLQHFISAQDYLKLALQWGQPIIREQIHFTNTDAHEIYFEFFVSKIDSGYCGTLTYLENHPLDTIHSQISTEKYRSIVENTPEILIQLDNQFRIFYANPSWLQITGYTEAETFGKTLNDFIAPEDREACQDFWIVENIDNQSCRKEFRLHCANGQYRWISMMMKFAPTSADRSNFIVTAAILDITDRKETEEALRRSEARYAILASSTTDGIWDWDLSTDQVYFSPRWKAMLGYSEDEIENNFSGWYQRVHPEDIKTAMTEITACLENRQPVYENIHRLHHKDGSWRWILDRGIVLRDNNDQPYRMIGSHSDVTSMKKTEEALQQRERELQAIFSISPDGIITVTQQGRIQSVNPAFLEMTGFDPALLIGLSEQELNQYLQQISDHNGHRKTRLKQDNQTYYLDLLQLRNHRLHKKMLKNEKIVPTHTQKLRVITRTERHLEHHDIAKVLYFRDISIESEVDQMKSEFLSTAAHELRTPMASVYGFSELLLSRSFDQETTQEILKTIHQQSASLVNMLNQLLDLARIESRMGMDFYFVQQPLIPIIQRAINELLIPGDQRQVHFGYQNRDFQVLVDADKLRQVIINVLSNAYKYSPQGGNIDLKLLQHTTAENQKEIGISIRDHGLGMDRKQLSHIFERFWRADNTGEIPGTGLGMSLVKEIMEIHQGHIEINSRPGEGTTVILWLNQIDE